ncbi:hypothetical protein [[Acholeplasma] multilocale]|uniref:hypothetical protein n=1 Tax=[Acholeplasma] multilocale TaxID=264638 RepID=UPI00047CACDD|nr:hypothetical protein [[Acholeplasma] multilocale]
MSLKILKEIRTNNFADPQMGEKFVNVWKQAEEIITKQKLEGPFYGVYHKYQSNYKGDYNYAVANIGVEYSDLNINETAHYKEFEVDTKKPNAISKTWEHIWDLEDAGKLNRIYETDFEFYDLDGSITIYIGVKKNEK